MQLSAPNPYEEGYSTGHVTGYNKGYKEGEAAQRARTLSESIVAHCVIVEGEDPPRHDCSCVVCNAVRKDREEQMRHFDVMSKELAALREQLRLAEAEQREAIEENHAIYILTGPPREGYTLQQEIRAQLEEARAE